MAGGTLTKWTAPAFFYGTLLTLLWWRGQLSLLGSRQHLVSAAAAAAVCLAWIGAAVALEGWETLFATVTREGMSRLVPHYAGHSYRWWETFVHPLVILLNTLPCSLALLWALRRSFVGLWDDAGTRTLQELHCWFWPGLVVMSLMTEHTPRHSFPLFPAVAGLAALVWIAWLDGSASKSVLRQGSRLAWPLPRIRPVRCLAGMLAMWLMFKAVFVFAIVPSRIAGRDPAAKGAMLAELVPPGSILYLFRVKDEGIMFYYGRPVQRLPSPEHLPASGGPIYCILTEAEWKQWRLDRPTEVVQRFVDEQDDPVVLVCVR